MIYLGSQASNIHVSNYFFQQVTDIHLYYAIALDN